MKNKFRVWDTKRGRWNINRLSMNQLFTLSNGKFITIDSSRYILTESTGRKDLKGIEIFEGDYIKYDYFDNCFGRYHKIGKVMLVEVSVSTNFDDIYGGGPDGSWEYENIEVIGNKFENPDFEKLTK